MLQIAIPCSFNIKMETEKALIVENIMVGETLLVREANLPKIYVDGSKTDKKGTTTAYVEKWVLAQRRDEERNIDIDAEIRDLIGATADMPF